MSRRKDVSIINKGFKDINPILFGYHSCESGHSFGPAVRDYYLIHYIKKGHGTFENSQDKYYLSEGDIFIILPGEKTLYYADNSEPWDYIWIGFDGDRAACFDSLKIRAFHYPDISFLSMLQCEKFNSTREEFLVSKLYEVISNIFDDSDIKQDSLTLAQNYIDAMYMTDIRAESVARTVGLSRAYLSRLFVKSQGVGMQEYIIQTRLKNARKLLENGSTVTEAAILSGFKDVFNFSKIFKKNTGCSPSSYKKMR